MKKTLIALALAAGLTSFAGNAKAQFDINTQYRGYYFSYINGGTNPAGTSYNWTTTGAASQANTGGTSPITTIWNSYFVFDLTGLNGNLISSVNLKLNTPGNGNELVYNPATFQIFDAPSHVPNLTTNTAAYNIYPDNASSVIAGLTSGTSWGTTTFNVNDSKLNISLNDAGVLAIKNYMNAGTNTIAIGAQVDNAFTYSSGAYLSGNTNVDGISWETTLDGNPIAGPGDGLTKLTVTMAPEPSTYALFALGALALVVAYRVRSQKVA